MSSSRTTAIKAPMVPSVALHPFVLMTFATTWGIVGFYIIRPDTAVAWFGEISGRHPAFILRSFVGNVSLAVIVTPLFNSSQGSILLPALFHFQLINPIWPDAQPYDRYFFVLVTLAIVWLNRAAMLARTEAVTAVIPTSRYC